MADTIPYLVDENDPDLESGTVEYGKLHGLPVAAQGRRQPGLGHRDSRERRAGGPHQGRGAALRQGGLRRTRPGPAAAHRRHRAVHDLTGRHRRHTEPRPRWLRRGPDQHPRLSQEPGLHQRQGGRRGLLLGRRPVPQLRHQVRPAQRRGGVLRAQSRSAGPGGQHHTARSWATTPRTTPTSCPASNP